VRKSATSRAFHRGTLSRGEVSRAELRREEMRRLCSRFVFSTWAGCMTKARDCPADAGIYSGNNSEQAGGVRLWA
jgi:hypothetical protein